MIEEWYIQNASITLNKVFQADPFICVNMLIYNINLLVAFSKTDLLLKFAYVAENVHLFRV